MKSILAVLILTVGAGTCGADSENCCNQGCKICPRAPFCLQIQRCQDCPICDKCGPECPCPCHRPKMDRNRGNGYQCQPGAMPGCCPRNYGIGPGPLVRPTPIRNILGGVIRGAALGVRDTRAQLRYRFGCY